MKWIDAVILNDIMETGPSNVHIRAFSGHSHDRKRCSLVAMSLEHVLVAASAHEERIEVLKSGWIRGDYITPRPHIWDDYEDFSGMGKSFPVKVL